MSTVVSGYALEQGEFVYTPQGRFQITGANENANNAFQDLTGWTVISAAEKTLADNFNINVNGYAEGFNSVVSLDATEGEGMYFVFEPSDAGATYVVSYTMKGATAVSTRVKTVAVSTNLVKVEGNSDNTFGGTNDVLVANTAEELTEDWQTFNYAIVGDGTPRTYYISFTGMATNIEIADVQIAQALQFADLRQRDAMVEKMEAYMNCYAWNKALLDDWGYTENLEALKAVGDENGQAELDEILSTCQEILGEFVKDNMDDYLAGNSSNYLGIKETSGNTQKAMSIGDWSCLPAGRGFWSNGAYPDMGHFQSAGAWNNGDPDTPMGVYTQKQLAPGSYVFSISGSAALREPKKNDWNIDEGLRPAYGVAYIVRMNGSNIPDTIVSVTKGLNAVTMTPFIFVAKIDETATYEIGFKVYCKEAYKQLKNGSVTYVGDAALWGKNGNLYNQKQLTYETNVRSEIENARVQLSMAQSYLADESYYWDKDFLLGYVDAVLPKVEAFEAMSQEDIIATYDEDEYVNTVSNESGLLQYTVYEEATRPISSAIRDFLMANDVLVSLQAAIDNAEATLALRIYGAATGKDELAAVIADAKDILAQMKKVDYSGTNKAIVISTVSELNEAVEFFKTTVPASAILTLADIDFENEAILNEETGLYRIPGTVNAMEFSGFSTDGAEEGLFEKGFWNNKEQMWKGYLRVGNGTGTVDFTGTEDMGTSILKVSCDFYIQGLSNRSVGFFLKDEADVSVAALYRNYYNGIDIENTFNVDMSKVWARSGGSYNNASPSDAENPTSTVIQKTTFEVVMDFGTKMMYCTITSPNGTTTSKPVAFDGIPTKFVLQSNYDNKYAMRRCWFDNLKIERYATEPKIVQGKLGDVNSDDMIDVTDVVLIIDDILERDNEEFNKDVADVNSDGEIDITDVVMVIDAILGKIELSRGAELIDRSAYTAFQMDLTIPAGYVLESVTLTDIAKDSHSLAYNMLPDGRCRVVVCSMNNEALPGAWDEVISLNLRGKGDAQMTIDRAVFVTIDGERHELMMNPTSIAELSTFNSQLSTRYDLQGRKIEKASKGILIENGKKIFK